MREEIIIRRYEALFQMVLDINGVEERYRGKTGDKPTAMFHFYGHCGCASISIIKNGWYPFVDDDISLNVDCQIDSEYENACKILSKVIEGIKKGEQ